MVKFIPRWNIANCNNMGGSREFHATWNKSDRKGQELCDITYQYPWDIKQKQQTLLLMTQLLAWALACFCQPPLYPELHRDHAEIPEGCYTCRDCVIGEEHWGGGTHHVLASGNKLVYSLSQKETLPRPSR